jgi:hypothetical protein
VLARDVGMHVVRGADEVIVAQRFIAAVRSRGVYRFQPQEIQSCVGLALEGGKSFSAISVSRAPSTAVAWRDEGVKESKRQRAAITPSAVAALGTGFACRRTANLTC